MSKQKSIAGFLAATLSLCALALVAAMPALARDAAVATPALWKIDGPNGDVYLFGSVHLLPKGVNWRTPAIDSALKQAQTVTFEIELDDAKNFAESQRLIGKLGLLPQGTTLRKMLAPEHRAKFERVATAVGLAPQILDGFRPWLAAVTISVQWIVSKGYDPNSGVDREIWEWSRQNSKTLGTLETLEEQLNVFAGLTSEQETEYLVVSLDQIETTPGMLDDMLNAWRKGDTKRLDKVLNEGMNDFPELNRRLLADRHAKWLPQIEKMLTDGRTHLIVVGTAHLVGKGSVIDMLRAKGIKVEGP